MFTSLEYQVVSNQTAEIYIGHEWHLPGFVDEVTSLYLVKIEFCLSFFPEMMLARKQYGLASQAMHELGNVHYHAGNIR